MLQRIGAQSACNRGRRERDDAADHHRNLLKPRGKDCTDQRGNVPPSEAAQRFQGISQMIGVEG